MVNEGRKRSDNESDHESDNEVINECDTSWLKNCLGPDYNDTRLWKLYNRNGSNHKSINVTKNRYIDKMNSRNEVNLNYYAVVWFSQFFSWIHSVVFMSIMKLRKIRP